MLGLYSLFVFLLFICESSWPTLVISFLSSMCFPNISSQPVVFHFINSIFQEVEVLVLMKYSFIFFFPFYVLYSLCPKKSLRSLRSQRFLSCVIFWGRGRGEWMSEDPCSICWIPLLWEKLGRNAGGFVDRAMGWGGSPHQWHLMGSFRGKWVGPGVRSFRSGEAGNGGSESRGARCLETRGDCWVVWGLPGGGQ